MMRSSVIICVLIIFLELRLSREQGLAIVEYSIPSDTNLTPEESINKNAETYIELIYKLHKDHNIAVIIFPEGTLDNVQRNEDLKLYSTKVVDKENPCNSHKANYPTFLHRLSCAARKYDIIIVMNLIQEHNDNFYTSDVVLLADGSIKYSVLRELRPGNSFLSYDPIPLEVPANRKFHFAKSDDGKTAISSSPYVSLSVTSMITGFSFSYEKIINQDEEQEERYYLVCSNWISQLPFLTSLQVYQMWAQEYNFKLLFSGANNPKTGQGGTGIFDGGPVLMDIVGDGGTKAYVYYVNNRSFATPIESKDIDTLSTEMDKFKLEVDPDLHRYEYSILNLGQNSSYNVVLCYNKTENNHFCCDFTLRTSIQESTNAKNRYTYHLVAYKGYKTYFEVFKTGGVEICGVVACLGSSPTSCGKRFRKYEKVGWPITFEEIIIKAKFSWPLKDGIYLNSQFPSSLLSSMRPINPKHTNWSQEIIYDENNVSYIERIFSLTEPHKKILTFAIFGRNFTLQDERSSDRKLSLLSHFLLYINIFAALF
ncbi:hypothetical protein MTP99_011253 [Tenebrio molitor]|nr:hypothetical protein MTP99_011253 [Tenebrio molitor]